MGDISSNKLTKQSDSLEAEVASNNKNRSYDISN